MLDLLLCKLKCKEGGTASLCEGQKQNTFTHLFIYFIKQPPLPHTHTHTVCMTYAKYLTLRRTTAGARTDGKVTGSHTGSDSWRLIKSLLWRDGNEKKHCFEAL